MNTSSSELSASAAPKKNRWVNFSGMSLCSDGQSVVMKADLQTDPTRVPHARGDRYTLEALVSVQLTFFDKSRLGSLKRGDTVFVTGPLKTWQKETSSDIEGRGEVQSKRQTPRLVPSGTPSKPLSCSTCFHVIV